ncbi:MAG TPA: hypothetical protein VIV65_12280 [Gemmatimonadaceae bacterium]|jgi:hypothetical protein
MTKATSDLKAALQSAVKSLGEERVLNLLRTASAAPATEGILTIIVNAGIHHLPMEFERGDVFVASEGTLDLSSPESIRREFHAVLSRTAKKLRERDWTRVYVVPFGPTVLSMQVKLLVYRVCAIETVDIMNVAGGNRAEVAMDLRQLVVDAGKGSM